MVHLLLARCAPHSDVVRAIERAFHSAAEDPREPRVTHVSTLDLSAGPGIGRVRAAFGFGWQAREWLRRVEQASGWAVGAVVEVCPGDRHHLLGLGRVGVPSVRWTGDASARQWVDKLAAQEGSVVLPDAIVPSEPEMVVRICLDALDAEAATLRGGAIAARSSGKA